VSASALKTSANLKSPEFEKNARRIVDLLTKIKNEEEQILQGGGAKAIESQHKKGRLTARERVAKLIDPGSQFFELAIYAAYEMYEEWVARRARGRSRDWRKFVGAPL
jgi:acetyl-CoA carboxylase carboxyltransferase component